VLHPHLRPQENRFPSSLVRETLGYGHTSGMERIKCGEEPKNWKRLRTMEPSHG
jgi:hypothetical protein